MEGTVKLLLCYVLLLQNSVVHLYSVPADESNSASAVVSVSNITAMVGSKTILQCQSHRMVWTQDSLKDRQRVVHWDLYSSDGSYKAERLVDMYSAGEQRIYSSYNQRRIFMPETAFFDGNFSLVIKGVADRDQGIYSCNLHHHYCHLYRTEKIQLDVTYSAEEEKMYWDGEKVVIVAMVGRTIVLPCENRNHLWMERHLEEDQQVVHWDRQPPGIPHDQADRLVDLYASGERRSYGPLFIRKKMNISHSAFAKGDFSLRISELERADEGTYSCHLHHHYCGLHERRIFHLSVKEPMRKEKPANRTDLSIAPAIDSNVGKEHKVINVIIPESRMHFIQQLGYILATLLLFLILLAAVVLITRRHRKRGFGYDIRKSEEKEMNLDYAVETTDQNLCKSENIRLDYKNNILKERAGLDKLLPAKNIDLDKEFRKEYCK